VTHTASIGIVLSKPGVKNGIELLGWADVALYAAKRQGRNQAVVFDEVLRESVNERSRTELTRNLPPLIARASSLIEPLFQGADMGALPTLRAATDPGVLGGQYFGPDGFGQQQGYPKLVASSDKSHDVDVQRRLWAVSEELTGVVYPAG